MQETEGASLSSSPPLISSQHLLCVRQNSNSWEQKGNKCVSLSLSDKVTWVQMRAGHINTHTHTHARVHTHRCAGGVLYKYLRRFSSGYERLTARPIPATPSQDTDSELHLFYDGGIQRRIQTLRNCRIESTPPPSKNCSVTHD